MDKMKLALVIGALLVALSLWWTQRNKAIQFDLLDLLMENGKVSRIACVFLGTWAITSYVLLYMLWKGTLTEGVLAIYNASWVSPLVAKVVFNRNEALASTEVK